MTAQKKRPRDEDSEDAEQSTNLSQRKKLPALITAARYGQTELVKKLIDAKAHPDTVCPNGRTPLYYAVIFGHADTVQSLLTLKADATKDQSTRNSYLHHAARQGYTAIMEMLLNGHDPEYNLFDEVIIFGQVKALEWLLQRYTSVACSMVEEGIIAFSRGLNQRQALPTRAFNRAQLATLEIMSKFIPQVKEEFSDMVEEEKLTKSQNQRRCDDFLQKQRKGETSLPGLVEAIAKGNEPLLELLLSSKSDIEAGNPLPLELGQPSTDDSALIIAAKYNRLNMVEMLLKAKANINKVNRDGQTALDCAQNNPAIKKILEIHGAKPLLMGFHHRAGARSTLTHLNNKRSSILDQQALRIPLRLAGVFSPIRPKISAATLGVPEKMEDDEAIPAAASAKK